MLGNTGIKYDSFKHNTYDDAKKTYCEMLLGLVVLIEVDTGSVILLHGVAG